MKRPRIGHTFGITHDELDNMLISVGIVPFTVHVTDERTCTYRYSMLPRRGHGYGKLACEVSRTTGNVIRAWDGQVQFKDPKAIVDYYKN